MKTELIYGLVTLLEAVSPGRWLVRMIAEGKSKNGNEYSAAVLKKAVKAGVFNGVAAQAMQFSEGAFHHLPKKLQKQYPNGFADVTVGATQNARYSQEHGGVVAELVLNEATKKWFEPLLELGHKVKANWGWSIKGGGNYEPGSKTRVKDIAIVKSLDFVNHPAAGGATLGPVTEGLSEEDQIILAEALSTELPELAEEKEHKMDKEKLKKLLARARGRNLITTEREAELLEACDERAMAIAETLDAVPEQEQPPPEPAAEPASPATMTEEQIQAAIDARVRPFERRAELAEAIEACELPEICRARISGQFKDSADWTAEQLQEAINSEVAYVQSLTGSPVSRSGIKPGLDSTDKLTAGLALDWDCGEELSEEEKSITPLSAQQIWCQLSEGRDDSFDRFPNIPPRDSSPMAFAEAAAASDTFSNIILNIGIRKMQKEYRELPNIARTIASVETSQSDFKRAEWPILGGFDKLPEITPEGSTLQDAAIPGDLKAYYDPAQYGNILSITRKLMKNNDLQVVQRLLRQWARGAVTTLEYASIYELLVLNATWADGTALYHANHANLDATINLTTDPWGVFESARDMMKAQTIKTLASGGSTELRRYQNLPWFCIVGPAGHAEAEKVLAADNRRDGTTYWNGSAGVETDAEANVFKKPYLGANNERLMESIVISSTDVGSWWVADPRYAEGLIIGYVDGRMEPWMTREQTNSGAHFETGSLRYSMWFEFGVTWGDYQSTAHVDTP